MALADTMVVMNQGAIEQAGAPHTVYNRPRNEFVARFMGGHNVIDTGAGKVGVRADQVQLLPAGATVGADLAQLPLTVSDVEYQGTYVLVGLQPPGRPAGPQGSAAYSAMLTEAAYASHPFQVGEAAHLCWQPGRAHPLGAPGAKVP